MNLYYRIRLWYWWNYSIQRDEFSHKLDFFYLYEKLKHKLKDNQGKILMGKISRILVRQRNIAHVLDINPDLSEIPTEFIKRARI